MSDSKSTEEQLEDLIDILDGPAGFVKDLNDLIAKRVEESIREGEQRQWNKTWKAWNESELDSDFDEFMRDDNAQLWPSLNQTNKGEE